MACRKLKYYKVPELKTVYRKKKLTKEKTEKSLRSSYPFGMCQAGLSYLQLTDDESNKYLCNGKELQEEFGLDWYDYGARFYDAQLGRWHVVDPMSESYISQSPYHFSGNNPIYFIEQNGMFYDDYFDETGKYLYTDNKTTDNIKIINSKDWKQISREHTAAIYDTDNTSLDLTAALDKKSTSLESSGVSSKALSNIFTNIIGRMDEVSTSSLHNGAVSIYEQKRRTNTRTGEVSYGYNDPNLINFAAMHIETRTLTINSKNTLDKLNTVSNVQNILGAHEYTGHFVKGYTDSDRNHYKAYEYQINHSTWGKTTDRVKKHILLNYFDYIKTENPSRINSSTARGYQKQLDNILNN